jgi:hypothetical protein
VDARSTQAETQDDLYRRIFGDWLTAVPASRVHLDNLASLLDSFAESSESEQEALRHHFYHRILTSTAGNRCTNLHYFYQLYVKDYLFTTTYVQMSELQKFKGNI